MTTSDTLSMSLLATSVHEALVQQKQLKIVLSPLRLAFTFFQKLYKNILLSNGSAHTVDHLM
jgi:hypothetical protein